MWRDGSVVTACWVAFLEHSARCAFCLDQNLVQLNDGLYVGVIGNISHHLGAVLGNRGLKLVDGLNPYGGHAYKRCRSTARRRYSLAYFDVAAQKSGGHGDVLAGVILEIESAVFFIGIKNRCALHCWIPLENALAL